MSVNISSLRTDPNNIFSSVKCRMITPDKIISRDGALVCTGMDRFQLQTEDKVFSVEIIDPQDKREILDRMIRGFIILAEVLFSPDKLTDEGNNIITLYVVAMLPGKNMGRLEIFLSDKVKKYLVANNFVDEDGDFNELLNNSFSIKDGRARKGCFAYIADLSTRDKELDSDHYVETSKQVAEYNDKNDKPEKIIEDVAADTADELAEKSLEETEIVEYKEEIADKTDDIENVATEIQTDVSPKGIRLSGKDFDLVVVVRGEPGKEHLLANKVIYQRTKPQILQLGKGELVFSDVASKMNNLVVKAMTANAEYMETWNHYNEMEGTFYLQRVREIGPIQLVPNQHPTFDDNGNIQVLVKESSKKALEKLSTRDCLEVVSCLPDYIFDETIEWSDYKRNMETSQIKQNEAFKQNKKYDEYDDIVEEDKKATESNDYKKIILNKKAIKIVKLEADKRLLTLKMNHLPEGELICSIRGNAMQVERREKAKERIMKGDVPNPKIARIIAHNLQDDSLTDYGVSISQEYTHKTSLTGHIKSKIFPKNPPTPTQFSAIDMAINTPDIAIIQGPPGTGKTTVITAIIERLNELSNKNKTDKGRVLITSLQHDAVNNVIERIRINSIPTVKFGKKNNDDEDNFDNNIAKWCRDIADKIRCKNPSLQVSEEQALFAEKYRQYTLEPNNENAIGFLNYALRVSSETSICKEIENILSEINSSEENELSAIVPMIRRLRVKEKSFADDGKVTARRLYNELEKYIPSNDEIMQLLKAIIIQEKPDNDQLKKLKIVKERLLLRCISKPVYKENFVRPEIVDLYTRIKHILIKPSDEKENILVDFLNELETYSPSLEKAVASYNYAFAATAQQCDGADIYKAKGIHPLDKTASPEYDTVIVDEAARVSPGDLIIPLSQAKERIILVGDHRQLPHMYDEEIFEELRNSGVKVKESDITVSMFHKLKDKALFLEKIDGVKRFITLDAQYRTHPMIGEFVSQQFYEKYQESFSSPLGPEFFTQPFYDVPLVWIEVPYDKGNEYKYGTSRFRNVEVDVITDKIEEFINKDNERINNELDKYRAELKQSGASYIEIEHKIDAKSRELNSSRMSYGVITFYSAQVSEIKTALKRRLGATIYEDFFQRGKLRVGSVDAFQGMEFDVIFLSIVRTAIYPKKYDAKNDHILLTDDLKNNDKIESRDTIGMANYGFLTSPNRLCVALSRQKRLLIIVGDSNIFIGEEFADLAEYFVPSLKNLYIKCQNEGLIENA